MRRKILCIFSCGLIILLLNPLISAQADREEEKDTEEETDSPTFVNVGKELFKGQLANAQLLSEALHSVVKKDENEPKMDDDKEWSEFDGDLDQLMDEDLDPGSWQIPIEIPQREVLKGLEEGNLTCKYFLGIKQLLGTPMVTKNVSLAIETLQDAADAGHPHANSALGFIHSSGYGVPISLQKGFLYHAMAAGGGSYQSQMALSYLYARQQVKKSIQVLKSFQVLTDSHFRKTIRPSNFTQDWLPKLLQSTMSFAVLL